MPARIGQIHHRTASQRIEVARQAGHPALSNQIQTLLHPPPPVTINHHPIPHRILSHTPHRCQPTPTIHSYHCRIHSLAPPRHVSIDNTTVQLFTPQSHLPNDRARPLFTTPGKPIKHNLRPPPLPRRASSSFGRAFPPQRVRERAQPASHRTTPPPPPPLRLRHSTPPIHHLHPNPTALFASIPIPRQSHPHLHPRPRPSTRRRARAASGTDTTPTAPTPRAHPDPDRSLRVCSPPGAASPRSSAVAPS